LNRSRQQQRPAPSRSRAEEESDDASPSEKEEIVGSAENSSDDDGVKAPSSRRKTQKKVPPKQDSDSNDDDDEPIRKDDASSSSFEQDPPSDDASDEDFQEEDEQPSSSEEEDEEEIPARRGRRRGGGRKPPPPRKRARKTSSDEEDVEEWVSSDEEVAAGRGRRKSKAQKPRGRPAGRRGASKKAKESSESDSDEPKRTARKGGGKKKAASTRRTSRARVTAQLSDSSSEAPEFRGSEDDEESEDEVVASSRQKPKKSRAKPTRATGRRTSTKPKQKDSEDEFHDSSDESDRKVAARPTRRKAARGRNTKVVDSDSDDSHNDVTSPPTGTRQRRQRTSARKARERVSYNVMLDAAGSASSEDEDRVLDDTSPDKESPPSKKPAAKKRRIKDDDEDFIAGEGSVDQDDDDNLSGDEQEDNDQDNNSDAPNIDQEVIGTQDDSSVDDTPPREETMLSPGLREISPSQKDDSDSSGDENVRASARPKLPECFSTHDPITAEELPKRHVCFISNDGNRQCFALSTLHKIAMSATLKRFREDIAGNQVQTFLQPPHFRSEMSDDMLDQIASRFGREALSINGDFYKRPPVTASPGRDSEDSDGMEDYDVRNALADNNDFLAQVQQYAKAQMGSQDLYVCPLCFSVAQNCFNERDFFQPKKKAKKKTNETLEEIRDRYLLDDRLQDPMAVLKVPDSSYSREMEIASTFCYKKVSSLKVHIRDDHGLKTTGIEGNHLYVRYKVRAQDGLLQRYLFNLNGNYSQGSMKRYWNLGSNFDFVHLLCLVDRAQIMQEVIDASEEEDVSDRQKEEAEKYWKRAQDFFDSFGDVVEQLWELITEPHRKSSGKDMDDFIANENEEVEDEIEDPDGDEGGNHRALFMDDMRKKEEADAEQDRLLVERYESQVAEEEESEEDDEELSEPDSILEGEGEEDEEESDTSATRWEKELKNRRKSLTPNSKKKAPRLAKLKKTGDSDDESDDNFLGANDKGKKDRLVDHEDSPTKSSSATKQRRRSILDEGDSDSKQDAEENDEFGYDV